MKVAIKSGLRAEVVDAEVIERQALDTSSGKHLRPYLVRVPDGRELTVWDDEGDGRTFPGECGPAREGTHGVWMAWQLADADD